MIVGISTSSPQVGVALFATDGEPLGCRVALAQRNASELALTFIDELLADRSQLTGIVVDVGPGGFTGVKIGVTIAKAFALAQPLQLWSVSTFDLISLEAVAVVSYKRGALIARTPGQAPRVVEGPPKGAVGYGEGLELQTYPDPASAFDARAHWVESTAVDLVPAYFVEPSISVPKRAFPAHPGASGTQ